MIIDPAADSAGEVVDEDTIDYRVAGFIVGYGTAAVGTTAGPVIIKHTILNYRTAVNGVAIDRSAAVIKGIIIFKDTLANIQQTAGISIQSAAVAIGLIGYKAAIMDIHFGVTVDKDTCPSIVGAGGAEGNHWYHVTLLEGRNREVRRLWASQDVTVSRLKRVRYGAVFLPKRLRMGDWSVLTAKDHQVLHIERWWVTHQNNETTQG